MNENMVVSGSTMANYMDVLVPLLVAEVVLVALVIALYFFAVHTRAPLRDDIVERVFWAFRRVRKFTSTGFAVSFVLFYVSLFMGGMNAIALRDASMALFLLVGWGGLLRGAWLYFGMKKAAAKKAAKKTAKRKKQKSHKA